MLNSYLGPRRVIGFVTLALVSVASGTTPPVKIFASSSKTQTTPQSAGSGKISGSVHRQDGRNVPAVMVVLFTRDGRIQRVTKTDAEGRFMLSGIAAGVHVLQACGEEVGPSDSETVELKAGMDLTQDLTMSTAFVKTAEPLCSTAPIPQPLREYTGEAMSYDLNGDLTDFFRSIASISGLEVNVDPSISRTASVHLKNVPWDLALDVVLRNSGLGSALDRRVLRIAAADPALGQDRILMGTVTIQGKIAETDLQDTRTLLQVRAPNADGTMHIWPVEWETAAYLKETGIRPDMFRLGDQVIVTGNLIRSNTIRLISIQRPSDGFAWGYLSAIRRGLLTASCS